MSNFPLPKLVEVVWEDMTTLNTGWLTVEGAVELASQATPIKTVGYVAGEDDINLVLVMLQSSANNGEVGVTATIPKGCIRQMKVLKGL
jgi:hypothetical protein